MPIPFRLLDLPREIQRMIWKEYFHPFDIELVQHTHHSFDGVGTLASVVFGFGSPEDLSLPRISPTIRKDVQKAFEKAFTGKLRICGCPECVYHGEDGRLPLILRTIPRHLVRHISTIACCTSGGDVHFHWSCKTHDPYFGTSRLYSGQHILDCRQFPMLQDVDVILEDAQFWDAPMEDKIQTLRRSRPYVQGDEQEIITAARSSLLEDIKQGIFKWIPSKNQRRWMCSQVKKGRFILGLTESTRFTMQFFEVDGCFFDEGADDILSGGDIKDSMVLRVSLGSSKETDRYEVVETSVQEKHAMCRCGVYTSMSQSASV